MKPSVKQLPSDPFDKGKDSKKVMRELLKKSKSLSHEQALRKMKEAAEAQKKRK